MNLLQMTLKQARQRTLSTLLTILSITLGVGLVIAVTLCRREGASLFGQTNFGYELLIGAKGDPFQLVYNTVFDIGKSPGNIPYTMYEQMTHGPYRQFVKLAVPSAVGDSYKFRRIVATLPSMFGLKASGEPLDDSSDRFEYKPGESYQFTAGHCFAPDKFEAVIGSDITRLTGLKIGDSFHATHGFPAPGETPDIHKPTWTVVGQLAPTHTAADGVIFIPLISFYTIAEHGTGLVAQTAVREGKDVSAAEAAVKAEEDAKRAEESEKAHAATSPGTGPAGDDDGPEDFTLDPVTHQIHLLLPKDVWGISAILVKTRGAYATSTLDSIINLGPYAQSAKPVSVMLQFYDTFLNNISFVLLVISILVVIVAAVGILVSIYNSVISRGREIAIFRALGATRLKVLTMICAEAGLIGLIGAILGLILGHTIGLIGSTILAQNIGTGIHWSHISPDEYLYLLMAIALSVIAGFIPALVAYRTPVATNLTTA